MRDHVVDQAHREMHEAPAQADLAVGRAAAPARGGGGQRIRAMPHTQALGIHVEPLAEQPARLRLQPALHAILDLLLGGRGRQAKMQHARIGIEHQRADGRLQLERDRLAQEGQRRAILPLHRRQHAACGAGAPFRQLGEDPLLLFGDGVLDLTQRDPTRRGDRQPPVIDDKADGAPRRALEVVHQRTLAQRQATLVGAKRYGGGIDCGWGEEGSVRLRVRERRGFRREQRQFELNAVGGGGRSRWSQQFHARSR